MSASPSARSPVGAEGTDPPGLREQVPQNQRTIDRLNRELAKKAREVRIIQQISSAITSTLDLDHVLEIVLGAMDRVLGFQHSMILLKEPSAERLRLFARRGYDAPGLRAEVGVGEGAIGVVAEREG